MSLSRTFCCASLLLFVLSSGLRAGDGPKGPPAKVRLGKAQALKPDSQASVAFSPDGDRVAWVTTTPVERQPFATVTVHVWHAAKAKEVCRGEFTADAAMATTPVTFSGDGGQVLVGTYHEVGGPAKSTRFGQAQIRVFDAATGKEVPRFESHRTGDTGQFNTLAVLAGGKKVATSRDGALEVWDLATGKRLSKAPLNPPGDDGGVFFPAMAPNGKLYAECLGNGPVHIWSAAKGKKLEFTVAGTPLAFSRDARTLATAGPKQIRLWSTATGKEGTPIQGVATAAAFAADGALLAWAATDKKLHVTDLKSGKDVATFPAEGGPVAISPNGRAVASLSPDGTVLLWTMPGGRD